MTPLGKIPVKDGFHAYALCPALLLGELFISRWKPCENDCRFEPFPKEYNRKNYLTVVSSYAMFSIPYCFNTSAGTPVHLPGVLPM